jgi:uncharacterized membrane protein
MRDLRLIRILVTRKMYSILRSRWLSNKTLLVKAILYQLFSFVATFIIAFAVTGNFHISFNVSILDFIGKTMLYYIFDVSWNNLIRKL